MPNLATHSPDWIWKLPPQGHLSIVSGEIHLWKVILTQPISFPAEISSLLSVEERARSDSFRFEEQRHRFILSRGILRILLARYLCLNPRELRIPATLKGKPYLDVDSQINLQFNLSHSFNLMVFAFVLDSPIGVDIEQIRMIQRKEKLAKRFYSSAEVERIFNLPSDQQDLVFLQAWTRKEAYLKATGEGLIFPLSQIEVSLGMEEPAQLLHVPENSEREWCMVSFEPESGYIGAVVYRKPLRRLRCFQLDIPKVERIS